MSSVIKQIIKQGSIITTIVSKLVFICKGNKINLDIYNTMIANIDSNIADIEKQILSLEEEINSSIDDYNYTSKIIYMTKHYYVSGEALAQRRKNLLENKIASINYKKSILLNKLQELQYQKEILLNYSNDNEVYLKE